MAACLCHLLTCQKVVQKTFPPVGEGQVRAKECLAWVELAYLEALADELETVVVGSCVGTDTRGSIRTMTSSSVPTPSSGTSVAVMTTGTVSLCLAAYALVAARNSGVMTV